MRQILKVFHPAVLALLLASAGSAQEETEPAADDSGQVTEQGTDVGEEPEAAEIDDDSYLDIDDDDFTPSEEIPADQSIDFPTDI